MLKHIVTSDNRLSCCLYLCKINQIESGLSYAYHVDEYANNIDRQCTFLLMSTTKITKLHKLNYGNKLNNQARIFHICIRVDINYFFSRLEKCER